MAKDQDFQNYMNELDVDSVDTMKDTPHPTEKGRTLLGDLERKIDGYMNRLNREGSQFYNTHEGGKIRASIRDEYFPNIHKKKKPFSDKAAPAAPVDPKVSQKFEPFYKASRRQFSSGASNKSKLEPEQHNDQSGVTMREVDSDVSQMNRDYIYEHKAVERQKGDQWSLTDRTTFKYEKSAKENNVTTEDLLDSLKDTGNMSQRS